MCPLYSGLAARFEETETQFLFDWYKIKGLVFVPYFCSPIAIARIVAVAPEANHKQIALQFFYLSFYALKRPGVPEEKNDRLE